MIPDARVIAPSGTLLVIGMLAGAWKWQEAASEDARAPLYVDILHRAPLMYSFAKLVLDLEGAALLAAGAIVAALKR